jgi:hypothetical protein
VGSPAMPDPTRSWRATVSVLLIVLVLATTMGMVCHHHDQCSAGNCMLCHLVIASPLAMTKAIELVPVAAEYAAPDNGFDSVCRANERPSRAPPA